MKALLLSLGLLAAGAGVAAEEGLGWFVGEDATGALFAVPLGGAGVDTQGRCLLFVPLDADACTTGTFDHEGSVSHGFQLWPDCGASLATGALAPTRCYIGTGTSTLTHTTGVRTLRCDILRPVPAAYEPALLLLQPGGAISCAASGVWPASSDRFTHACASDDYRAPGTGTGLGQFGCFVVTT